jgi:hypothetical protein
MSALTILFAKESLLYTIAAAELMSALTIEFAAMDVTPLESMVTSPDSATDVRTPEPL